MPINSPIPALAFLLFIFSSSLFEFQYHHLPQSADREDYTPAAEDTTVNYCRLVRAAYFYGQKSADGNADLSPVDLLYFNEQWTGVFNVPFYQEGITAKEFSNSQPKFREGNHLPFPPSVRYHPKNADTYVLFHIAKEIGKAKSQAYLQCPTCIQESIQKINDLMQGTALHGQISQLWTGTGTLKKINSIQELSDFWLWLRCLVIDDRVNPVSMQLFVSLPPIVKTPDTTIIACKDEMKPKISVGYRHCELGGKVDTLGPMLIKGQHNCPGTVYAYKFVARDQCLKKDSAFQYFKIKNDPPVLLNTPADTIVECIEYYRVHHLKATSSCSLPVKVRTSGPVLISGIHNCPYAVYEMKYVAHDTCQRETIFKHRITIQNDGPTIDCPPNVTVECIRDFKPGHPTYTLSCYDYYASLETSSPILISGRADCDGAVYNVTYTLTDSCERKATCLQRITIRNQGPLITCPPNEEVLCEEDIRASVPGVHVPCDLGYDVRIGEPVLILGKPNCVGAVYAVTYSVTDACGRRDSCDQLFTILQPELLIECPPDVTVLCEKDIHAGTPKVSAACNHHYTVTNSGVSLMSGKPNCDGSVYTVTFTVKDDCGLVKTCQQKFTIRQPEPELVCPAEVTVDCDKLEQFPAPVPSIGCGLKYTSKREDPVLVSGKLDCDGSRYKVRYSITDECGRTGTCDFYITLHVPMPEVRCAKNENVDCERDIKPTDPVVRIICNHTYVISHSAPVLVKGIRDCAGSEYAITYTVKDDCGREVTCKQFFTITHGTLNIGCPENKWINCEDEIFEDEPAVQWGCKPGSITHTDPKLFAGKRNCPGAQYAITYKASDDCGSVASCEQIFEIRDSELAIDCPNDTMINTPEGLIPSAVKVVSPCIKIKVTTSGPVLISGKENRPGAIYQFNFEITDDCNRHAECHQRFTIVGADCSPYPGTHPAWDEASHKWICYCEDGYEWNAAENNCVPRLPDCSMYPGTTAVWDQSQQKYICSCATGYFWDANSNRCVPQVPDCSMYPGTTAVWDQSQGKYVCSCATGYVWDANNNRCVPQVPDCSMYPGTTAVWDQSQEKYVCSCATGYVWDANNNRCVPQVPDCSMYPGTTAVWDQSQGKYVCSCATGYVWDANNNRCIPQAPDCSMYPGTTAVWDQSQGKYICSCATGYVWDAANNRCVPQAVDCSMYPGTTAVWDYSQQKYICSCAQGYKWNQDINQCVLLNDNCSAQYPHTYLTYNTATAQWICACINGYEWNGTACVVSSGNRDNPPVNPQQQKQGDCNIEYRNGANEPEQYTIDVHRTTGSVQFSYDTYSVKDRIHIYYAGTKVFDSGCVGTSGAQSFTLNGYSGVFTIIVDPLCDQTSTDKDTQWNFTLGCPQ